MALLLNAGDTVSRSYSYTQPSPLHPSQPQGTGERTGNLYNINAHDVNNGYVNNAQLNQDGTVETWESAEISEYIPISGDTAYTFNGIGSYNSPCYGLYDQNKQLIGAYKYNGAQIINFTSPNNARYFRFTHIKNFTYAMMVEGAYTSSTMPEFEPYGYKIPISSANTTTPIYLGEVETTRKIGKIDLSEVSWTMLASGLWRTTDIPNIKYASANTELGGGIAEKYTIHTGAGMISALNCIAIDVSQVSVNTGSNTETPTGMFWYVLTNEETAVVNEPLMKIGGYADTLSNVSIPVTAGGDTISVGTTLQPSEATVNYKGWHPASVKEYHFDKTISDLEDMTISQMQTYTIISLQGGNWS